MASAPVLGLTVDQRAEIVALAGQNIGCGVIAAHVGCSPSTVSRFLKKMRDTTGLAKAYFKASADDLARRVVQKADVSESMEVLDRIDVLPKKRDIGLAAQFNVFVGVPGSPLPVPTDKEVFDVRAFTPLTLDDQQEKEIAQVADGAEGAGNAAQPARRKKVN